MKVLITGANGFLGQHLVEFFARKQYNVIATGKGPSRLRSSEITYYDADLTRSKEVHKLTDTATPDVIIHNAAMSKPDECERNKEQCIAVNLDSTRFLLETKPSRFIYLSTDFIFGENGPHSEEDEAAPLNFYGKSKLDAERLVTASGLATAIVRPVFIYGKTWNGMRPTFLHWVKNNLEKGESIKVVSDQLRTPTYAGDICTGIMNIITNKVTGAYHLAGKDIMSPYEMAVQTADVLGLDASLIKNVTADTFPEPVKRAKRSGLLIDKACKELGYEPLSFHEGIRRTFENTV